MFILKTEKEEFKVSTLDAFEYLLDNLFINRQIFCESMFTLLSYLSLARATGEYSVACKNFNKVLISATAEYKES